MMETIYHDSKASVKDDKDEQAEEDEAVVIVPPPLGYDDYEDVYDCEERVSESSSTESFHSVISVPSSFSGNEEDNDNHGDGFFINLADVANEPRGMNVEAEEVFEVQTNESPTVATHTAVDGVTATTSADVAVAEDINDGNTAVDVKDVNCVAENIDNGNTAVGDKDVDGVAEGSKDHNNNEIATSPTIHNEKSVRKAGPENIATEEEISNHDSGMVNTPTLPPEEEKVHFETTFPESEKTSENNTSDSPVICSSNAPPRSIVGKIPFPNRTGSTDRASRFLSQSKIECMAFNQDRNCIAIGTTTGFRIRTIATTTDDDHVLNNHDGMDLRHNYGSICGNNCDQAIMVHDTLIPNGLTCIRMLHCTSLLVIVQHSTPRCLQVVHAETGNILSQLFFVAAIRRVELNSCSLCVLTADGRLQIFSLKNMKLMQSISLVNGKLESVTRLMHAELASLPGYYFDLSKHSEQCYLACRSSTDIGSVVVWDGTEVNQSKEGGNESVKKFKLVGNIAAHDHGVACLVIGGCVNKQFMATCSQKGTFVRIFSLPACTKLYTLYRGSKPCTIYSISLTQSASRVAVAGSSGTIHLFNTTTESANYGDDEEGSHNNHAHSDNDDDKSRPQPPQRSSPQRSKKGGLFGFFSSEIESLRSYAKIKLKPTIHDGNKHIYPTCTLALFENTTQPKEFKNEEDTCSHIDSADDGVDFIMMKPSKQNETKHIHGNIVHGKEIRQDCRLMVATHEGILYEYIIHDNGKVKLIPINTVQDGTCDGNNIKEQDGIDLLKVDHDKGCNGVILE